MGPQITIIAPYTALHQSAVETIRDMKHELAGSIDVVTGDLGDGLAEARRAIAQGTEVIISRGGTAGLIARELDIPVVEIQVTAHDILYGVKRVEGMPMDKVAVAGFSNVVYGSEDLLTLLGLHCRSIIIHHAAEAWEKIRAANQAGVEVIVGDAISVKTAKQLGLTGILITSGKQAIYKAIKEAELVARVRRREKERAELLKTIVDTSTDGIVAVDANGYISVFNPMAEAIFQIPATQAIGRPVAEIIPNTRLPVIIREGKPEIGEIQHIGAKTIVTKRLPIRITGEVVGAIASFQDVTQLQRFEQIVRQKLYKKGLLAKTTLDQIVGQSAAIQAIKTKATKYARTNSTVLITGETGTGKEMLAQSIHNLSLRHDGPFVAVNCAALPETLLESELFGYEEGAFTGAKKGGKPGLFEIAHGGTLFLDEIGEMPVGIQARLLRVLQEKEVMRLGGDKVLPIDIRIIAATNQDLAKLVAQKQFRPDLLYRIDVLRLTVPPLRERAEDLPALVDHFLLKMGHLNPKVKGLCPEALRLFRQYHWPGNIRELANILEQLLLLAEEPLISAETAKNVLPGHPNPRATHEQPGMDLAKAEKAFIEQILAEEQFNYSRAAARLGINRTTLWRKLRKWDQPN